MMDSEFASRALLGEARLKAQRLLERLMDQQRQIEQSPPKLPPQALEQGRAAMQNAIDAARRALHSIDEAIQIDAQEDHLQ